MKKLIFVLVLLGLGAGGFYMLQSPASVEVIYPERGPVVDAVYATGSIEPTVMVPIAPRVSARLMSLAADEGAKVAKGALLAQLEDADLEKALAEQKARGDLAEKEFQRLERLVKAGAVSRQSFEEAASNLEAVRAAQAKIEAEKSYLRLEAPEDGVILRRDGEVGQMMPANAPVFWMSCCAPMRVTAEVDEEDVVDVRPGLPVLISADAFGDKIFKGKVQSITPKGDAVSRSYRVRITLDDDAGLMAGMTAESNIIVAERKDVLLVPSDAVDNGAVWVVKDGKLEKRDVKMGVRTKNAAEIISGLTAEDAVVKDPMPDMTQGKDVRTVKADWSPQQK
jgi:multidrug efflux system membrane fusion protein